jgi:uncharacterized damage-inducible protein DinB
MEIQVLQELFTRDLRKLHDEIGAYYSEEKMWSVEKGIANSAGNLCLHLIGNLNTYIGKELGGTPYERNRPLEFSQRNVPKKILLQQINHTLRVVSESLANLDEKSLSNEYPVLIFDRMKSVRHTLIHLATHLTWHLGQINYHRRLLDQPPSRNRIIGLN